MQGRRQAGRPASVGARQQSQPGPPPAAQRRGLQGAQHHGRRRASGFFREPPPPLLPRPGSAPPAAPPPPARDSLHGAAQRPGHHRRSNRPRALPLAAFIPAPAAAGQSRRGREQPSVWFLLFGSRRLLDWAEFLLRVPLPPPLLHHVPDSGLICASKSNFNFGESRESAEWEPGAGWGGLSGGCFVAASVSRAFPARLFLSKGPFLSSEALECSI